MKTLFNDSWYFKEFDPETPFETMNGSKELEAVEIPHDWMIWHVSDLYKNSIGFYKKTFNADPVPGHTYMVRFEGVYMDTRIYLNGVQIFEWKYGYSTFDVDLTGKLNSGANELAVSCTYRNPNSRWYSGAGIYRNVYFIEKNDSYLPLDGIYIHTDREGDDFKVTVDTEAVSKLPGGVKDATIKHCVTDASGKQVMEVSASLPLNTDVTVNTQEFTVEKPRLWDIEDPYSYRLVTTLTVDGKETDSAVSPLGFRTIRFDCNEGFFLNDRNVKINGVCQHHDLGSLGSAMNKTALRRQFEKLKKMGVNSIRTSHNMPAKEVMELADEMGLLVYTESFDMWELPKTTYDYGNYFPTWYERDITSWVRRDINHPSLIIWGIGNEIYDTHAGTGLKWTILLRDAVRKLDYRHNAYIGIGSNYIEWENAQKCSDELELSGYNYGERLYDAHHQKYPHWCIFGSETSSTVQSRGIYHFPYEVRILTYEDGQCSCLGNCSTNWGAKNVDTVVSAHRDRDFVSGQYLWSGWDYIGEPTPFFTKNSFFGQIDTAGFEKDTYYHYQAEWTDVKKAPMVHLLPYWDFNDGQIIDVCAYSNAPYVELFFNGESLGKKFIDHAHGTDLQGRWKVPYRKGEIKVVATDEDGNIVATDSARSFGDPVKVTLTADKETLTADSKDLCFIEINVADAAGTIVANAKNRVTVSVEGAGRLLGLDNGDSTDYEEYKGSSRRLFSGKLLAIVGTTYDSGDITVKVTSDGLESAELKLTALPSGIKCHGSGVLMKSFETPHEREIPIRKIELKNLGTASLNADNRSTVVEYKILPENATYSDVVIKALTKDAVEANFIKISVEGNKATVTALGDGEFRLTAFANNDKDHPEIISDLEMSATGLGQATHDPYKIVPGCQFNAAHSPECKLSFLGGVFLTASEHAYVTYDNVDFGEFGSDEIVIPVFSFHDELDVTIYEGSFENGECLGKFTYKAKTWYNHYQENTFKLSRRIKGTTSVTVEFNTTDRMSFKGFYFKKPEKAYALINATDNLRITGDSFKVEKEAVTSIGNNVSLEFDHMDFSVKGLSAVTICGRSHNEKTSIHIMFFEGSDSTRQLVEIPYSEDYQEVTIPLKDERSNGSVSLVFLPGSNFDLKWFRFKEK